MSRPPKTRAELLDAIEHQARVGSTQTILFHTAIAEKLGLNPSDHKVADILVLEPPPVTAGRLAELTGLTTGAITGVLDRLEHAGFIAREHDPSDRRRIIVKPLPRRMPEVVRLFEPIAARLREHCAKFTADELFVVLEFMQGSAEIARDSTKEIREQTALAAKKKA
jgi:DNA-binding MarR family transcriptional regulator